MVRVNLSHVQQIVRNGTAEDCNGCKGYRILDGKVKYQNVDRYKDSATADAATSRQK
jgi:hypothetical protein